MSFDLDRPQFREPWEAQAFALVLSLHQSGAFTWKQWAACLSETITKAQAAGDPDTGESYYQHWLTALETLTASNQLVSVSELSLRQQAWRDAVARTPHGQPIELHQKTC